MNAPSRARPPPISQTPRIRKGVCTRSATTYGLIKMPEPTMPPITIMVASNTPSRRRGLTGSKRSSHRNSWLDRDHLTIAVADSNLRIYRSQDAGCDCEVKCRVRLSSAVYRGGWLSMKDFPSSQLDLQATARQVMLEHGFEPDFPAEVPQQLAQLKAHPPQVAPSGDIRDLRQLLWSSIDNDTSRDLDQIEVAERLPTGGTKVLVGIADVDAFVLEHSPIDEHAARETTTVYTGIRNFPMLPEELSTGASSLLEEQDKLAIVIEFIVSADGEVDSSQVYRAVVRNQAQLAYDPVGAWLENRGEAPAKVAASTALQSQLKLQNEAAQALRNQRYRQGALNIETTEVRPVVLNQQVIDVVKQEKTRATELIEDFMIAANGVVARLLENVSSLRRIVKTP